MDTQVMPIIVFTCAFALAVICVLVLLADKTEKRRSKPWGEFAQETGLSFIPGSVWKPYSIHGVYRGHQVRKAKIRVGDYAEPAYGFSLFVANPSRFSLSIGSKLGLWIFRLFLSSDPTAAKWPLESCFNLRGRPQEYLERVIDLIEHGEHRLLEFIMTHPPIIQLKGSRLICIPADPIQVNDSVALLNLSCDIADLTKHMSIQTSSATGVSDRG